MCNGPRNDCRINIRFNSLWTRRRGVLLLVCTHIIFAYTGTEQLWTPHRHHDYTYKRACKEGIRRRVWRKVITKQSLGVGIDFRLSPETCSECVKNEHIVVSCV